MSPPPTDDAASLSFEDGGLPASARERIARAAEREGSFFTTTFSVAEMAIARLAGYQPISQVMGSSIYHVGFNFTAGYSGGELEALAFARKDALDRALGRMRAEAHALGAHAVVGVRLAKRNYEWSGELLEFTAVGTAVRVEGARVETPALSNLTVQQLYKLELAGLWPLGLVMGNSAWYDHHADCAADGAWFNQELPDHTACIDNARAAAHDRFKTDIAKSRAVGVVGVDVSRDFREREWEENDRSHTSFKVEILMLGTAVERRREPRVPRPRLVLDLGGGRRVDLTRAEARINDE